MKRIIIVGLMLILIISAIGSGISSKMNMNISKKGYFIGNVFNNGRIKIVIKEKFAKIYTSDGSRAIVDKYYPELDIFENNTCQKVDFTTHMYIHNNYEGWHFVTIFMKNRSNNNVLSLTLTYAEKTQFRLYAPLFPHLELRTSNTSVKYRVIWHLEGLGIRDFALIKNETHKIIYHGRVHGGLRFERGQDIMIGYDHGKKMFGLNWENWKKELPLMEIIKREGKLNINIKSNPRIATLGIEDLPYPIPDTGTGSGKDSDGDGLYDFRENEGWDVMWHDSSGNYHIVHVTSDPNNPDTDGDGVSDYYEWAYNLNPRNMDTDGDSMSDYYELIYGISNGGWQEPNWYNHRYAVIIVGGGFRSSGDYAFLPAFWNDGKAMYDKLVNDYRYKANEVYLMSSRWYVEGEGWKGYDPSHQPPDGNIIDGEAMWNSSDHYDIKDALDDVAKKITVHDSLLIVIIAHGDKKSFMIRSSINYPNLIEQDPIQYEPKYLYYTNVKVGVSFSEYINNTFGGGNGIPRKYAVMTIIIQACNSGVAIKHLYGDNRILITSSKVDERSYTETGGYDHWAFLFEGKIMDAGITIATYPGFIKKLGNMQSNPQSLYAAYLDGYTAATNNYAALGAIIVGDYRSHPQIYNSEFAKKVYL